jgi:hypothetical protein
MVHSRVYAEAIALGAIILISTTVALSQTIVERFPGPGNQRFIPEKIGRPLAARDLVEDIKQQFLTVTTSKTSGHRSRLDIDSAPATTTGLGSR